VFAWACADAEPFTTKDLPGLYRAWEAHGSNGVDVWCCKHRKQKPQPPVARDIVKAGLWDEEMQALPDNWQDAETQAIFAALAAKRHAEGQIKSNQVIRKFRRTRFDASASTPRPRS
jgi:hypothetical protein